MGSWRIQKDSIVAPLELLKLNNGRIAIPAATERLYVEIGTNSFDTWDQVVLKRDAGGFLVSFEPLVDKWALLLSRGTLNRQLSPLGHHHRRGVILPFAVSDRDGEAELNVSPRDGCSSLRAAHVPEFGAWRMGKFIKHDCARTVEVRRVPTVSLATVLSDWLAGWQVHAMKIDAQGVDLHILATTPHRLLTRVREVKMEVLHDSCDVLYVGQPNCSAVVRQMRSLGFANATSCEAKRQFGNGCEANFQFVQTAPAVLT